jgi:outer membrane lipoprotein-sorting protein
VQGILLFPSALLPLPTFLIPDERGPPEATHDRERPVFPPEVRRGIIGSGEDGRRVKHRMRDRLARARGWCVAAALAAASVSVAEARDGAGGAAAPFGRARTPPRSQATPSARPLARGERDPGAKKRARGRTRAGTAPRRAASPAPDRPGATAREVLAYFKVALGKLTTLAGTLRVTYAAGSGGFNRDHVARFWFARPFKLRVSSSVSPTEMVHADYRMILYYPEARQVVTFDLTGGGGELVRRFFSLFEIGRFLEGTLLADVEAQFGVEAEERPGEWRMTFRPRDTSLYRLALEIERIEVTLDRRSMLPRRLDLFEQSGAVRRKLCAVELDDLRANVPIPESTFVFKEPRGTTQVPSSELLRDWVVERMTRAAGQRAVPVVDEVRRRLTRFAEDPWNFGSGPSRQMPVKSR